MNPTPGDVHVNRLLTNVSIAFTQDANDFVASAVFPNVPVDNQGNLYQTYSRDDWWRVEVQERAPATETAGGGWRVGTDNYFARVYGVHKDVDDQTVANQDPGINMDRDATEWVTLQLMLKKEILFFNKFFTTGVWTTDLTGVTGTPSGAQFKRWDAAGSTPIEDIRARITLMKQATGMKPNVLVLGPFVFDALLNNAELIARIQYTQRGVLNEELIASLLGIDRVVVGSGVVNNQPEGTAGVGSFIAGKSALLAYAAPRPSLLAPSGGYTFSWTGYLGAGAAGNRIKKYRMENIASDRVEGEMAFDLKLVSADLGVFWSAAVS